MSEDAAADWDGRAARYADVEGSTFRARWQSLDNRADRDEVLRLRYRHRRDEFLRYCFPDLFYRPFNAYHRSVLGRPRPRWQDRRGRVTRRGDAAPRGIAKTTLIKGEIAHAIVYGLEAYIVIVSAEKRLARGITKDLRAMFTDQSSPLARLYGPFQVSGGVEEFSITTGSHTIGVLARSFGTQMRGANSGSVRPTMIVIDDGERPDRVRSPQQREIWWRFLVADILKAGPLEGGLVVEWRGTVLHADSVMARILKDLGWAATRWRACIAWPTNAGLWEQCGRIWADLALGDIDTREDAARAFYLANREAMDEGVEMLDDNALDVFRFHVAIWSEGMGSVLQELQNEPRDPTRQLFDPEKFAPCWWDARSGILTGSKWDGERWIADRKMRIADLEIAIWHDRAKGGPTNDYPATAVVARDAIGYRYVLRVVLDREPASAQRARVWRLWEDFRAAKRVVVGCDDTAQTEVFAGESWERDRQTRRASGRPWNLEVQSHTLSEDKNARIDGQEPDCKNGWLQFAADLPPEVAEQYRDRPNATHDDAPDAIERADWLLSRGTMPTVTSYSRGR